MLREDIGPFSIAAGRFAIASLVYLLILRGAPAEQRRPGGQWRILLLMGLTGVFGFSVLLYLGLRYTTAANGALITGISPILIGVAAAIFLGERFTVRHTVGGVISLAGVAILVSNGSPMALLGASFNLGDLLILIAYVLWALYTVMGRMSTRKRSALSTTAISTWMGLPPLLVGAFLEWRVAPPHLTPFVVGAILYIGLFAAAVAMLAWHEAIRRGRPAEVSAMYNLLPVYGALMGVLIVGESLSKGQLLGGALVLIGGTVTLWSELRRHPERNRLT
jgi:drug/metabolite transporter (DMT)-like permease